MFRKVIRIRAEDSPNVQFAKEQLRLGLAPSTDTIVPGVVDWETYQHRRATWDKVRQSIGLDGEFYEGQETLLYPPDWLNLAEQYADKLQYPRAGAAMGVDSAEGGDDTCWAVIDKHGLIELRSKKTPDTAVITGTTLALMREYNIPAGNVLFDQGGGGQQHADRLHTQGYKVSTVSFGESTAPEKVRYLQPWEEKLHDSKERFTYRNRRAQMYWALRLRLDPSENPKGFAIPAKYTELRRQLAVMPLWYDEEGRIELPPKRKRPGVTSTSKVTIQELIGCSPDEADALVMACYKLFDVTQPMVIRPMF